MTLRIEFEIADLTVDEAEGLISLLTSVKTGLLTLTDVRQRNDSMYGSNATFAQALSLDPQNPPVDVSNAVNVIPAIVEAPPAKRGRKPKEDQVKAETADAAQVAALGGAKPNISASPEDRVDPAHAAQDTADEQAEVEGSRDADKPLTKDDIKAEMTRYMERFTLPVTQQDGPAIFASALGAPPAGEAGWRLSLVDGLSQALIAKARDAWRAAADAEKRWGA